MGQIFALRIFALLLPIFTRSFVLPLAVPVNIKVRNIIGSKADKISKMNAYLKNLHHRGVHATSIEASFLQSHSKKDLDTDVFYDYLINLTTQLYIDLYLKQGNSKESTNGYKVVCIISKQKAALEQVMTKSEYEKILKKSRKVGCIVHEKILNEQQFKELDCKREPGCWTVITRTAEGYYKCYCLIRVGDITKNYHLYASLAKKKENDDIRFISMFT